MKKPTLQGLLTALISSGATTAAGLLALGGMFLITSSFYICIPVFLLTVAYEAQVNNEAIATAFTRLFSANYLKLKIIKQFLAKKITDSERDTLLQKNVFFSDYYQKQDYLKKLMAIEHPTANQVKLIKKAQRAIHQMEEYLLLQLEYGKEVIGSKQSTAVEELIKNDRAALLREIKRKSWWVRLSMVFALGGGICAGLATLSAGYTTVAALTFLSVIPGGVLLTLGILAAVGYALLLYQSIADMIESYGSTFRQQFMRKENESPYTYGLRCVGLALGITLAVIATVATAGTWWVAAKNGAEWLKSGARLAGVLRSISVSLMILPTFIFSMKSSIDSVNNISRSDYRALLNEEINNIKKTFHSESLFQFFNPFRIIEKIYTGTIKATVFLAHLICGGFMTDRMPLISVPPLVTAAVIAGGEGLTHAAYLPDEKDEHHHTSWPLSLLFAMVAIPALVLKGLAILWDMGTTHSVSKSYKRICSHEKHVESPTPVALVSETSWNTAEILASIKAEQPTGRGNSSEVCPYVSSGEKARYGSVYKQATAKRFSPETIEMQRYQHTRRNV
jgi:hypothetical protein